MSCRNRCQLRNLLKSRKWELMEGKKIKHWHGVQTQVETQTQHLFFIAVWSHCPALGHGFAKSDESLAKCAAAFKSIANMFIHTHNTVTWHGKWNVSQTLWFYLTYPSGKQSTESFSKGEAKLGRWLNEPFVYCFHLSIIVFYDNLAKQLQFEVSRWCEECHCYTSLPCDEVQLNSCSRQPSVPCFVLLLIWRCYPAFIKLPHPCQSHNPDIHSPPRCCVNPSHTCAPSQWSPWRPGPHRSTLGWAPWCLRWQGRPGCERFRHQPSCWRWQCCCSTGF